MLLIQKDDPIFNLTKIHKKKSHYIFEHILFQNVWKTDLFNQNYKCRMLSVFKYLKLSSAMKFISHYYKFVFTCKNKTNLNCLHLCCNSFQLKLFENFCLYLMKALNWCNLLQHNYQILCRIDFMLCNQN